MKVNLYEAKTQLSRLVELAMAGEEIIIAKAGKPMVKLVRVDRPSRRVLGSEACTIEYAEGWDEAMNESKINAMLGS